MRVGLGNTDLRRDAGWMVDTRGVGEKYLMNSARVAFWCKRRVGSLEHAICIPAWLQARRGGD